MASGGDRTPTRGSTFIAPTPPLPRGSLSLPFPTPIKVGAGFEKAKTVEGAERTDKVRTTEEICSELLATAMQAAAARASEGAAKRSAAKAAAQHTATKPPAARTQQDAGGTEEEPGVMEATEDRSRAMVGTAARALLRNREASRQGVNDKIPPTLLDHWTISTNDTASADDARAVL